MQKKYPSKEKANELFAEIIQCRKKNNTDWQQEFIVHSQNVANCASIIAKKTAYLNPDKAYVLGLLHDYGKTGDEDYKDVHHGRIGYNLMLEKGYLDVAKVCLTHTFPTKNFTDENFPHLKECRAWIRAGIENIEYDDYDRLIQLCDKFAECFEIVSIEYRVGEIVKRYNLSESTKQVLLEESLGLKQYFDKLCGVDVYEILGINDENSKL